MDLELGAFVVMPNHVHGIIIIRENPYNRDDEIVGDCRDAMHRVSTINNAVKNQFGPQRKNLASILRGYKSAVTVRARKNNLAFCWQQRFHDHIIRSMDDFHRISEYIKNNPGNWERDRFFCKVIPPVRSLQTGEESSRRSSSRSNLQVKNSKTNSKTKAKIVNC
jgi:REP element-mobilizing transposase RayT